MSTSSTSIFSHLPQELLDRVIDHLHDIKPALCAASTVSYAWLQECLFHLFDTVDISRRRQIKEMSTLRKFFSIIPQIGCHIRHLSICVLSSSFVDVDDLCDLLKIYPTPHDFAVGRFPRMGHRWAYNYNIAVQAEDPHCRRDCILQLFFSTDQLFVHTPSYLSGDIIPPRFLESIIPQDLVVNPGFLHINEITTCDTDGIYLGPPWFPFVSQIIKHSVNSSRLVSLNMHTWLLEGADHFRSIVLGAPNLEHLTLTVMIRRMFAGLPEFTIG